LEESMRRFVVPPDGSRGLALSLVLIALTPAICEEALFRGAILRGFAGGLPRLTSAVLTGVLFGLFHLDLWRIIPTALLGIGLSIVALETDSILPAMVMHFANNACLVALAYLGGPDASTPDLGHAAQIGIFVGGLAVVTAGAGLVRGAAAEPTNP